MYLSAEVFVESKFVRDRQIAEMLSEQAQEILNWAKALMFTVWKGEGVATPEQIADFYEVTMDVVRDNICCHRDEFESDGLKTIKGKALSEASEIISLTSQTVNVTL